MNRIFISLLGSVFLFASVFAEETPLRSTKAVKMQKLERSRLVENQPTLEARSASYWNKPYSHENRNGALSVLVDSSTKLIVFSIIVRFLSPKKSIFKRPSDSISSIKY